MTPASSSAPEILSENALKAVLRFPDDPASEVSLAFKSGLPPGSLRTASVRNILSQPGRFFVPGQAPGLWTLRGCKNIRENLYFYGSFVEGEFLHDLLPPARPDFPEPGPASQASASSASSASPAFPAFPPSPPKQQKTILDFSFLRFFTENLLELSRRKELPPFRAASGVFIGQGSVLLLPPLLTEAMTKMLPEREEIPRKQAWIRPELRNASPEIGWCFLLAVLTRTALCGEFPFLTGRGPVALSYSKSPRHAPGDPALLHPALPENIPALLSRSLFPSSSRRGSPTGPAPDDPDRLRDWIEGFKTLEEYRNSRPENHEKAGLSYPLSPGTEDSPAVRRFRDYERKRRKRILRAVFLNRRKALIEGIFLGILILGSLSFSAWRKSREPLPTKNLSPERVVRLFYRSRNTLDIPLLESTLAPRFNPPEKEITSNLFVISRVRRGYERKSGFIEASRWIQEGRPALPRDVAVYGITDLKIRRSPRFTAERPAFLVSYRRWETRRPESRSPDSRPSDSVKTAPSAGNQEKAQNTGNSGRTPELRILSVSLKKEIFLKRDLKKKAWRITKIQSEGTGEIRNEKEALPTKQ